MRGEAKEGPLDLPDKIRGGVKLAKRGARRFAPQLGLRGGQMEEIYPYEHGDLWARIPLSSEDLQLYTDTGEKERVSFVFKEQIAIVASTYCALDVTVIEYFFFPWRDVLRNNKFDLFEWMTFEWMNNSQRSFGLPVGSFIILYCLFNPYIISVGLSH